MATTLNTELRYRCTFGLSQVWIIVSIMLALATPDLAIAQSRDQQALQKAVQTKNWPEIERVLASMKVNASTDVTMVGLYTLALVQQNKVEQATSSARRALDLDSLRMQSWLVLAECYSRGNNRSASLDVLRRATQKFSDSVQTHLAYGLTLVKYGQHADAISPLEEVMFRRPDQSVMFELALCYFATGQFNAAAELYQLLVEQYPDNAAYQRGAGESLMALKKLPEAIRSFDKALLLDSNRIESYLLLTGALTESNDSARALKVATAASARFPQDAMAWYNAGLLQVKHRQYDGAAKALKKAIALRPNYGEAYFNLAVVYEQTGFTEDAANAFKRCALVLPAMAPDAYNSLAIMHRRNGNLTEALKAHEQAISLRDTSAVLHISRINSCHEAEKCAIAEGFIDDALRRFPNDAQVVYTCAKCTIRLGNVERARELIARLEKTSPSLADQLKQLLKM
ncbi:MAG: tetratricopeptide repeat protein [Ignavibacteria bacterium]